jgi:hypothetical protein
MSVDKYTEKLMNNYIECDEFIDKCHEKIKEYKNKIDKLNELKDIIDEALKNDTSSILMCCKAMKIILDHHVEKQIKNISTDTIINYINNSIHNIEHYDIEGAIKHKKLLLDIKRLGLTKYYYDMYEIYNNTKFSNAINTPDKIFEIIINSYQDTDYINELKEIMEITGDEFYKDCITCKKLLIQMMSNVYLGTHIEFKYDSTLYKIIKESVRINNLKDVVHININNKYVSLDDADKLGDYIIEGNNEIDIIIKGNKNEIVRSVIYMADRN